MRNWLLALGIIRESRSPPLPVSAYWFFTALLLAVGLFTVVVADGGGGQAVGLLALVLVPVMALIARKATGE